MVRRLFISSVFADEEILWHFDDSSNFAVDSSLVLKVVESNLCGVAVLLCFFPLFGKSKRFF